MKSKTLSFTVHPHKDSAHWVNVVLHSNKATMRSTWTRLDAKDYSGTDSSHVDAFCYQPKLTTRGCFAEIHLCRNLLTLENIAHEASHAAYHRTELMGIKLESEDFQEWVAATSGKITEGIFAFLSYSRIKIRYGAIPRRRANA